jgi:hypothetical protein
MCIYTEIYIYIQMHTERHRHRHTHTHTCVRVCVCIHKQTQTHKHIHTFSASARRSSCWWRSSAARSSSSARCSARAFSSPILFLSASTSSAFSRCLSTSALYPATTCDNSSKIADTSCACPPPTREIAESARCSRSSARAFLDARTSAWRWDMWLSAAASVEASTAAFKRST